MPKLSWDRLFRGPQRKTNWPHTTIPDLKVLSVCNDIKGWCNSHPESNYQSIAPARVIRRKLPRTSESVVDPSFFSLLEVKATERSLVRVKGALVVGKEELIVLPNGEYVGELIALTPEGQRTMLSRELLNRAREPSRVLRKRGTFYPLSAIGWQNYYHWNHDVIMRASQVISHLPDHHKFIIPEGIRAFQQETIKLLGIGKRQLVPIESGETWEVESLSFSTPIFKTQIDSIEPLYWFREACMNFYGIQPRIGSKRILISRAGDNHYRTTNSSEVEEFLSNCGFETVEPRKLTLREQVEIFSQAAVIIGTGTGLSNMVFAPSGATIVQFQEPSQVVHALWTMSEALGHHYYYLFGETVPNPSNERADIFVPIEKLRMCLEQALGEGSKTQYPSSNAPNSNFVNFL